MGEAPMFINIEEENEPQTKCFSKPKGEEKPTVVVQNKSYTIDGSFNVTVHDTKTCDAVNPIVLGTKPSPCEGFSAMALNDTRILLLKKGSVLDDAIWFLEVDTQHVKNLREAVQNDVILWSKGAIGKAKKPIVISGPSGVGKGTLISKLMTEFPSLFGFSVSHTTRAPRNMEQNGVHYHFTDKDSMMNEIKAGEFLEFASVHGNLYGTSVEAVEKVSDSGKICILDIDVQGASSVKASPLDANFIFISPPSIEALEKRLRSRNTESNEQIVKRLNNAKDEIQKGHSSGIFNHVLYNDHLDICYDELKGVLNLEGNMLATQKSSPAVEINLPDNFYLTKNGDKIIITFLVSAIDETLNTVVLDFSSITGGGPGRTRGIEAYTSANCFSNDLDLSN